MKRSRCESALKDPCSSLLTTHNLLSLVWFYVGNITNILQPSQVLFSPKNSFLLYLSWQKKSPTARSLSHGWHSARVSSKTPPEESPKTSWFVVRTLVSGYTSLVSCSRLTVIRRCWATIWPTPGLQSPTVDVTFQRCLTRPTVQLDRQELWLELTWLGAVCVSPLQTWIFFNFFFSVCVKYILS